MVGFSFVFFGCLLCFDGMFWLNGMIRLEVAGVEGCVLSF